MKKYILIVTAFGLLSCSQPNVTQNATGEPEISFDANGTHYSHRGEQTALNGSIGITATRIIGTPGAVNTFYSFAAYKNTANLTQLIIFMTPPDTLKIKTYHCVFGSGSILKADNYVYGFIGNNDYLDFAINSYSNGIVNATFSGIMTKIISVNPNVTQTATITNGVIKNVSLKY